MDGEVEIHLVKLEAEQVVPDTEHNGAVLVKGEPQGPKMGWMKLSAATRRCCRRTAPTASRRRSPPSSSSRPARATCPSNAGPRSARRPERTASEEIPHERTRRPLKVNASTPDAVHGYKSYTLGAFTFRRDEYFAHIGWTTATAARSRTRWTSRTSCAR
jgi:hypothetical protein